MGGMPGHCSPSGVAEGDCNYQKVSQKRGDEGLADCRRVAAVLDAMKDQATQELNWETSIVDLMKLLSMDSSLPARKELAKELHYDGDTSDSATIQANPEEARREWREAA